MPRFKWGGVGGLPSRPPRTGHAAVESIAAHGFVVHLRGVPEAHGHPRLLLAPSTNRRADRRQIGPSIMDSTGRVTELLHRAGAGDPTAAAAVFPLVYDELRLLAHRQLRRESSGHSLNTTALVHEAYLKLVDQTRSPDHGPLALLRRRGHRHAPDPGGSRPPAWRGKARRRREAGPAGDGRRTRRGGARRPARGARRGAAPASRRSTRGRRRWSSAGSSAG